MPGKTRFLIEVSGCDDCPFQNAEWLRCDCPVGSRMQPALDYDEEASVLVPAPGTPCPLTLVNLEVRRG